MSTRPFTESAVATAPAASDDAGVEIFVNRTTVGLDVVRQAARLLSPDEHARAERFAWDCDRRRYVVARSRLRELLAARLEMRPEAIAFVYGRHGKPALAPWCNACDLRFNSSRADDLTVVAVTRGREVGIDVEAVRRMNDLDTIAARFFSHAERHAYDALAREDRVLGFFQCWTRKEAFVKALGEGLSHPLDRFDVSLGPREPARILRVAATPGERCGWRLASFAPAAGFVAAVVTERGRAPEW